MRKLFALILVIGFTLVGCSQGKDNKSDDAQSENSSETKN